MIEIVSLVNFDNLKRVEYLDKSFASIHRYNKNVVHHVFDSSKNIECQKSYYDKYGVVLHHCPGSSYSERLKQIKSKVKSDYIVFLPDDYVWIYDFPIRDAINQARMNNISQVKLVCRGMKWFSQLNPEPEAWFDKNKVISGEVLLQVGSMFISKRRFFRDFHEQFSLGCTISNVDFLDWVARKITKDVYSPGKAEKQAYLALIFRRYYTAYYDMKIPAFHFADYDVEGERTKHLLPNIMIDENYRTYNKLYNNAKDEN